MRLTVGGGTGEYYDVLISALGHCSFIVRLRLTPKFDSIKLLTSSSLINTGSSQTLENHLCSAILTSLSSSSSVDADVEGKGRAGMIATKGCQYAPVREACGMTYSVGKRATVALQTFGTRHSSSACSYTSHSCRLIGLSVSQCHISGLLRLVKGKKRMTRTLASNLINKSFLFLSNVPILTRR